MPSAGFEPAISAIEQLQTHALDRTDTGIGSLYISLRNDEWIPAYTLRNSLRWSEKNTRKRRVLPGYIAIWFFSGKNLSSRTN